MLKLYARVSRCTGLVRLATTMWTLFLGIPSSDLGRSLLLSTFSLCFYFQVNVRPYTVCEQTTLFSRLSVLVFLTINLFHLNIYNLFY